MNVFPPRPRAFGLFLAVVWLAGCGGEDPRLQPLAGDAVILAFGDSLTWGTGAGRGQSYPAILENLTDRRVINAGVPGEESAAGVARLSKLLAEHRPALVVLCHGGNDILRKRDRQALRANLERMIAESRKAGAGVVLIGVPDFGLVLSTADVYESVAETAGIPLEKDVLPEVLGDAELKSDTVHPNAEGYRRLAQSVVALMASAGAL